MWIFFFAFTPLHLLWCSVGTCLVGRVPSTEQGWGHLVAALLKLRLPGAPKILCLPFVLLIWEAMR